MSTGVRGLSWAPSTGNLWVEQDVLQVDESDLKLNQMRLATVSGDDNELRIWNYKNESLEFVRSHKVAMRDNSRSWVTDVSWSQSLGIHEDMIAVSTESGEVQIFR